MADRVGVIDKGRILLVDDKQAIMTRLGRTEARFTLELPLQSLPVVLAPFNVSLQDGGRTLVYRGGDGTGKGKAEVAAVARTLTEQGIVFVALDQKESSLEDIFVELMKDNGAVA